MTCKNGVIGFPSSLNHIDFGMVVEYKEEPLTVVASRSEYPQ